MNHHIFRVLLSSLLCMTCLGNLRAQDQHWSCDASAYEYDMSVFLTLTAHGQVVENLADYEIAAFVGDECRGVGTVQTAEKEGLQVSYVYLRVRSNKKQADPVSIKVFDKVENEEVEAYYTPFAFQNQEAVGMPSSPFIVSLTQTVPGDVNDDGTVTTFDITKVVDYILTGNTNGFNKAAADLSGDGQISTFDITKIVNIIINQ